MVKVRSGLSFVFRYRLDKFGISLCQRWLKWQSNKFLTLLKPGSNPGYLTVKFFRENLALLIREIRRLQTFEVLMFEILVALESFYSCAGIFLSLKITMKKKPLTA